MATMATARKVSLVWSPIDDKRNLFREHFGGLYSECHSDLLLIHRSIRNDETMYTLALSKLNKMYKFYC